jgi:hypothetical protein
MVEGESGILSVFPPREKPKYQPAIRRVTWPNGAIATLYSADEPERLRGPQHDGAWCDEVGSLPILWSHGTGSELMQRIAVPMIGGMVSSTVLTLIVIPAVYGVVKGWRLAGIRQPLPEPVGRRAE